MAERLAVEGVGARMVVAVPLHPQRQRLRGYNQSELLSRELRKLLGLRSPPGVLVRTRATPPQVGNDRKRRLVNVAGAFTWHGAHMNGETVLLIDDAATTGATPNPFRSALRAAGSVH